MKWWPAALVLAGCVTARPTPTPVNPPVVVDAHAEQRAVVDAFLAAVGERRFDVALSQLSKPWRDRYDEQRLARDFEQDPVAAARVKRVQSHRADAFAVSGAQSSLGLGDGRALRLVREESGWKISALE